MVSRHISEKSRFGKYGELLVSVIRGRSVQRSIVTLHFCYKLNNIATSHLADCSLAKIIIKCLFWNMTLY